MKQAALHMRGRWFGMVTAANLQTAKDKLAQCSNDSRLALLARQFAETVEQDVIEFGPLIAFQRAVKRENARPRFDLTGGTKDETPPVSPDGEK